MKSSKMFCSLPPVSATQRTSPGAVEVGTPSACGTGAAHRVQGVFQGLHASKMGQKQQLDSWDPFSVIFIYGINNIYIIVNEYIYIYLIVRIDYIISFPSVYPQLDHEFYLLLYLLAMGKMKITRFV